MEYRVSDKEDVDVMSTEDAHNYEVYYELEVYTYLLKRRKSRKIMWEPYVTEIVRGLGHQMGEDVSRETMKFKKSGHASHMYWTVAVFEDDDEFHGVVKELKYAVDDLFMARKRGKVYTRGYMKAVLKGWGIDLI